MRVDLGRLTDSEMDELLRALLVEVPEDTAISAICEVVTGNMREELIASLQVEKTL